MTGKILIDGASALLNDSQSRRSDDVPFYDPAGLLVIAEASRESVYGLLRARALTGNRSRTPAYQRSGRITISRMLKSFGPVTDGTDVPDDFWKLSCARTVNGLYVPAAISIQQGESLAAAGRETIWVRAGKFKISAQPSHIAGHTAFYWAKPVQAITYNDTTLTDFPDVFYTTVITHIALEAILEESLDVKTRYAGLEALFMKQISRLK